MSIRPHSGTTLVSLALGCLFSIGASASVGGAAPHSDASSLRAGTSPPRETLRVTLEYPEATLSTGERDGYTEISLPGGVPPARAGAPSVPRIAEHVVLPGGATARRIEVVSLRRVRRSTRPIHPVQPPAILGPIGVKTSLPAPAVADPSIYEGSELFPREIVQLRGVGSLAGQTVASLEVHPIQYDPATREIVLHTEIEVTVHLESRAGSATGNTSGSITGSTTTIARSQTEARALSPAAAQLIERLRPINNGPIPAVQRPSGRAVAVDLEATKYLIVTNERQRPTYEVYADWKTAKGLPARVVTTEQIVRASPGRDDAEKIRNYVIGAVAQWGTSYVLLAGDQGVVPSRIAWAFDCRARLAPDENDLHADLYYSDLDGSWDQSRNGIFGEVGDQVDLYPDVFVGRAPTVFLSEASQLVAKFLLYDRGLASGHTMDAYFFAEVLWANPYTDGGVGKDRIAEHHFAAYEPVERHYESLGNETTETVVAALNRGPHLVNHSGHAYHNVMGCGAGYLTIDQVDRLSNAPHFFVLFSMGCWSAAFDYDSIGEHFVRNPGGGAIAFIGNSRYGWGSPGNPGWGYSDRFDEDFYGAILSEGITELGAALAWAKIQRIPFSQDANIDRWHQYQVNLLGDPEMRVHTAELTPLVLDAPETVPVGAAEFVVSASDARGPVEGARLCLAGDGVYLVGSTDAGGRVVFTTDLAEERVLTLTATAPNHTYAEATITVGGGGPLLAAVSVTVDDDTVPPSSGNGDGRPAGGETVELYVDVRNSGTESCYGVEANLIASMPGGGVGARNTRIAYGTIDAGAVATNRAPFIVEVPAPEVAGTGENPALALTLELTDDAGRRWSEPMSLGVVAPEPRVERVSATVLIGNGDAVVEPGETVALSVRITNTGDGALGPVAATLTERGSELVVVRGVASLPTTLDPGAAAALDPAFTIRIDPDGPATACSALELSLSDGQRTWNDVLLLSIGELGFADDMEGDATAWTHSGENDAWHRTERDCHSGTRSWYLGTESGRYPDGVDAALVSPIVVVPASATLSFWCAFDVTIYGIDGFFVEVLDSPGWKTLDYLGSGGALDSLLVGCGWSERVYDISGLEPGSTTRVRFRFQSDRRDTAGGVYIDDVALRAAMSIPVASPPEFGTFALTPQSANPMGLGTASWRLSVPVAGRVTAEVYGAGGRLTRRLLNEHLSPQVYELRWDGRTHNGQRAPAGVYFLLIRTPEAETTRKIVRVDR